METRLGFIGIVIEDLAFSPKVNAVIGQYMPLVRARMGIPDRDNSRGVVTLIVEGTTDELGALTGKLGAIESVTCKSQLTKVSHTKKEQ